MRVSIVEWWSSGHIVGAASGCSGALHVVAERFMLPGGMREIEGRQARSNSLAKYVAFKIAQIRRLNDLKDTYKALK